MHPASLPARPQEDLVDRFLEALMRIGDNERHPGKTPGHKTGEETPPERVILASADLKPEHLALAALRDAVGDDKSHGDDPGRLIADLLVGGIQEEVGVATDERPASEGLDLGVQAGADARDLAFGDAVDAEGVREIFHLARGDALYVGFGDDGKESLLASAARLKKAREVASFPKLGDGKLERAHAGIKTPFPISVTHAQTIGGALTKRGAGPSLHVDLHELPQHGQGSFAQQVDLLPSK